MSTWLKTEWHLHSREMPFAPNWPNLTWLKSDLNPTFSDPGNAWQQAQIV